MDGNDVIGASDLAAPDLADFDQQWDTPGMKFKASDDQAKLGGYVQVLDIWTPARTSADCKLDSRYDYNDGYYRGKLRLV